MLLEVIIMVCDKCRLVEMRMYKVDNDNMIFKCKRCGNEKVVSINEMIKNTKKV